jgi:hypothetical protein
MVGERLARWPFGTAQKQRSTAALSRQNSINSTYQLKKLSAMVHILPTSNTTKALFICYRIHLNPHTLVCIRVKFNLSSTLIHPNPYGLR